MIGTIFVLFVVIVLAGLAVRSIQKQKKKRRLRRELQRMLRRMYVSHKRREKIKKGMVQISGRRRNVPSLFLRARTKKGSFAEFLNSLEKLRNGLAVF